MQNFLKIMVYPTLAILFAMTPFNSTQGQTFGFGCLGLSGIYGGYSVQRFEAGGLNESIIAYYDNLGITEADINFGEAKGLRLGANIFRAKFDNYFITLKGFYQLLEEKQSSIQQISSGNYQDSHLLELNHWGVGLDIGVPIFRFLDLKLVEGGILFYNAKYKVSASLNDQALPEVKYENSESKMGYYVATGIILHLIPDYVSLEGSAIYSFIQIESLDDANGNMIPNSALNKNFIESGKVAAAVQLNIGFPL